MDAISDISVHPIKESKYVRPFSMSFVQNGNKKQWDLVQKHDSVVILIHNTTRDVFVFVTQFRASVYMDKAIKLGLIKGLEGKVSTDKLPGSAGITHELCAGIVDKDCSLEQIAKEEVLEECGYDVPVECLQKISTFRNGVGVSSPSQTMYYAQVTDEMRVSAGGGNPAEGEFIELVEVPVKDSLEFVTSEKHEIPGGVIHAILWFHTPGLRKDKSVN